MSRALVVVRDYIDRARIARWAKSIPDGSRVEFKAPKRSLPQNDRMWAMLTEIAAQKTHAGRKFSPPEWKVIFMHAWGREVQFVPSLDEHTFIPFAQSSSDLSVAEMAELITFMQAWGAQNGVDFHDPSDIVDPASLAGAQAA
jgi:hypothetical protein